MSETTEVQVEEKPSLSDLLKGIANAPTQEQIEKWKAVHGDVFVSGFSETDLYVWRPISRKEWRDLQVKSQSDQEMVQLDFEEVVFKTCLLWSSIRQSIDLKGGTISTIYEQILQNSNFMAPQTAAMFVARL